MKALKRQNVFWVAWGLIAILSAVMYYFFAIDIDFIGVVETRTHKLSAQESGRIDRIFVTLGDQVQANQLLVTLDSTDLEAEKEWLEQELVRLEDMMEADRSRFSLEYEKLRLQSETDASRLGQWRSELEMKKAELAAVNGEIERLTAAQKEGLGRPEELSNLIIRRDTLTRFIQSQSTERNKTSSSKKTSRSSWGESEGERVVLSMLSDRMDRIHEIRLRLKILDTRMNRIKVITPCEGRVVKINYLPGDSVEAFATILTVEEPDAEFIDAYVPETSDTIPRLGERVGIYPHRTGQYAAGGTVVFVDPSYSSIPERLAFRKLIYWARKFRVKIDDGDNLVPGEAAQVKLLSGIPASTQALLDSYNKSPSEPLPSKAVENEPKMLPPAASDAAKPEAAPDSSNTKL